MKNREKISVAELQGTYWGMKCKKTEKDGEEGRQAPEEKYKVV